MLVLSCFQHLIRIIGYWALALTCTHKFNEKYIKLYQQKLQKWKVPFLFFLNKYKHSEYFI